MAQLINTNKEMKLQLPSIRDLASALVHIKNHIEKAHKAEEYCPFIQVTLGADEKGYGLQTGDNSYAGNAYGFRYWGVEDLYRGSNCREVAKSMVEQIKDQFYQ